MDHELGLLGSVQVTNAWLVWMIKTWAPLGLVRPRYEQLSFLEKVLCSARWENILH